jgi:general secretion pathway protein D
MIFRQSVSRQTGRRHCPGWLVAMLLSGCTATPPPPTPVDLTPSAQGPRNPTAIAPGGGAPPPTPLSLVPSQPGVPHPQAYFARGTGALVGTPPVLASTTLATAGADGVTLDFSNAEIRDVARSVLGELLALNYVVDPQIQGQITIQTSRPIPRESVLSTLEIAFRTAGVALVQVDGIWRVVPLANAARGAPLSAGRSGPGYSTRIIPLHWVSAADLQRAIEPLLPTGTLLRADTARNILIVSGADQDVADVVENVAVFDVDTLQALSFALVPLRSAQARAVAAELPKVLGTEGGPAAGMVKFVPLERLNAILVTSLQPAYLERARAWIERLDLGGDSIERRIYVYRVQNGRAADLAAVLGKLLGIGGAAAPASPAAGPSLDTQSAPAGLPAPGDVGPTGLPAPTTGNPPSGNPSTGNPSTGATLPDVLQGPLPNASANASGDGGVRITADEANNALLVLAAPQEWGTIQAALAQLDIEPLQVLIDTSIAEVTLTGQLNYGLQYFFSSGNFQFNQIQNATGSLASSFPGLNLIYAGGNGVNVILQLLEQLTTVRVLSSPDLLVLNNQKARLQVGDQVPIATQSAISTQTSTAPIVNSIEYRDTGVILQITPRVNASGLVLLDISQEVSAVSKTTSSDLDSPTIQQRRVASSVAIQDGQTVALGGLISDTRTDERSGIPILKDIPYLGFLFGIRDVSTTRTELLVLITPHVVRDRNSAIAVTEELRRKLPLLTQTAAPKHSQ